MAVVRGRAEVLAHDPTHRERYELVVSRAFGAPAVTAECGAGFVAVGGRLVVSEPPERSERWPPGALEPLGLGPARPCRETASFVVLRKEAPTPAVFPRRAGMPAKRPLF